jgi:hypothetical protein
MLRHLDDTSGDNITTPVTIFPVANDEEILSEIPGRIEHAVLT